MYALISFLKSDFKVFPSLSGEFSSLCRKAVSRYGEDFAVVISAQICYDEAQVIKATYPLHGFVGHPAEPWERPLIRKAATRFGKPPVGIIRLLVNNIVHENHKD